MAVRNLRHRCNVRHIKLRIADRLRKHELRLIRDQLFIRLLPVLLHIVCRDPVRLKAAKQLYGSAVKSGCRNNFIAGAQIFINALVSAAIPEAQAILATPCSKSVILFSNASIVGLLILV